MKTETRQFIKLLKNACCSTPTSPLAEQQLLTAIREIYQSLQQFILPDIKPSAVGKNLLFVWQHIVNGLHAIQNTQLDISASCLAELESLCEFVSTQLHTYQQPGFIHGPIQLIRLSSFKQSLEKAKDCVHVFSATPEEYNIIYRHIDKVLASRQVCSFAWIWWSYFCHYVNPDAVAETPSLNAVLTGLNFNCCEYLAFLHTTFKNQLNALDNHEEKISFLTAEQVKYKLLEHTTPVGYYPQGKCVGKTMLSLFKFELHGLKMQNNPQQLYNQQIPVEEFCKIETTLSVPQLALLARLLIDAHIIKTGNQAALLKQVAAVFSARGTSQVSPKSLRVNYYEPASPAKNIVKDHLFAMLNQLKKY